MVALIELATDYRAVTGTQSQSLQSEASTRVAGESTSSSNTVSTTRTFNSSDPGYITVEPDGRDDIGFRDRLRQAIDAAAQTFADRPSVADVTNRVLEGISGALDAAESAGGGFAVQLRIASVEIAVSESGNSGDVFASIRQFALEVSVARNGSVSSQDVRVFARDGRSLGLSAEQIGAGFRDGRYQRVETGARGDVSEAARERLEAARTGLERVKAVQDALSAFRDGNEVPLRNLLQGDGAEEAFTAVSRAQVFPGVGPVSFS